MEALAAHPHGERLHYLYGFVESSAALPAIDGVEPDAPVFAVASGAVAGVVSVVAAGEYGDSVPARDERWLTSRALRHHDVLCALHRVTTVLPLRFGALCATRDDVVALLADRRAALEHLLSAFRGQDEWTLRMAVDAAAIADRAERESPVLIDLRRRAEALSAGQAYFVRKQHVQAIAAIVQETIAGIERTALERLERPVVRGRADAASAEAAILVGRDDRGALEAALADLEAEHAWCGLQSTLVGPWPPYRFASAAGVELGRE